MWKWCPASCLAVDPEAEILVYTDNCQGIIDPETCSDSDCERWANHGECKMDYMYMGDQCYIACEEFESHLRREAPAILRKGYKANGDDTPLPEGYQTGINC
jgi:hypothetical protein